MGCLFRELVKVWRVTVHPLPKAPLVEQVVRRRCSRDEKYPKSQVQGPPYGTTIEVSSAGL